MDNPLFIADKPIECLRCGLTFTLSVGEVKFYLEKKLSIPKRCGECREHTKRYGKGGMVLEQIDKLIRIPSHYEGNPAKMPV